MGKRDAAVSVGRAGEWPSDGVRYHNQCGSVCDFVFTYALAPDGTAVQRVETFCPKCRRNLMEGEYQIL